MCHYPPPCHSNRRCRLPSCGERCWLTRRSTSVKCANFLSSKFQSTLEGIPVETRATYLLSSMRNGAVTEDVRQMAAVLLRRVISNEFEDFYSKVFIFIFLHSFHAINCLQNLIQIVTIFNQKKTCYVTFYSYEDHFILIIFFFSFSWHLKTKSTWRMSSCQ